MSDDAVTKGGLGLGKIRKIVGPIRTSAAQSRPGPDSGPFRSLQSSFPDHDLTSRTRPDHAGYTLPATVPVGVEPGRPQKTDDPVLVVRSSSACVPAMELPDSLSAGDQTAAHHAPGMIAAIPPPIPLLAGMPTR